MKIKKILKLYKELRELRHKVKILDAELSRANRNYNALWYKKSQEVPYSTMSIMLPNLFRMESEFGNIDPYSIPKVEYLTRRMTNEMKIKLVDDLISQGYIIKTRDDDYAETYEIKVVR